MTEDRKTEEMQEDVAPTHEETGSKGSEPERPKPPLVLKRMERRPPKGFIDRLIDRIAI